MFRCILSALEWTTFALFALTVPVFGGNSYKVLHWFKGKNGGNPIGGVTLDPLGNLYGTTNQGGAQNHGKVFELVQDANGRWAELVLHTFCSQTDCADGSFPQGGLIFDSAGNLYGATTGGGSADRGVVFQLNSGTNGKWVERVLYNFCAASNCADGYYPTAALVLDAAGNLYGTTLYGGAYGEGTVFELIPGQDDSWTEKVLYSFCAVSGCADGAEPFGNLIFDSSGNIYGTTFAGGAYSKPKDCVNRCGTVFKLTPGNQGNWTEQVLHSFNYFDGADPQAGLILDKLGNLYGTARYGGRSGNGLVFQLSPGTDGTWTETVIHAFYAHLAYPTSTLIFDTAGNLYGTANGGGKYGLGLVFRLSPSRDSKWIETVLYSFYGRTSDPWAGVILDSSGNLYGTTIDPISAVFEITP